MLHRTPLLLRLALATALAAVALPGGTALAAPVNDLRANATTLVANGLAVNGTTVGATKTTSDAYERPGSGTHDVWYRWTAPAKGLVTFRVEGTGGFDPMATVYLSSTQNEWWRTAVDVSAADSDAVISMYVKAGQTWDLVVDGETAAAQGSFTLDTDFDSTPPAPGNDAFATPMTLEADGSDYERLNQSYATGQAGEPAHRGTAASNSLWYSWTPAVTGGARIKTNCYVGADWDPDGLWSDDPIVAVYTGSTLATLSQVTYSATKYIYSCNREWVQFMAQAGVTYRIAVDSGVGDAADNELMLSQDTTKPTTTVALPAVVGPKAKLTFDANESADFECKYDGAAPVDCTGGGYQLNGGADGSTHKLEVRATDVYGNVESSWKSDTFKIDAAPPETTVLGGPPAVNRGMGYAFSFASEPGATHECRLTGKLASHAWLPEPKWFACTSGFKTWTFDEPSEPVLEVRATDAFGNVDPTPAKHAWRVDETTPTLTWTHAPKTVPVGQPLTWTWTASEDVTYACKYDGADWAPCGASFGPLTPALGTHTLTVRGTDAAGNNGQLTASVYVASPATTTTTTTTTTTSTTTQTRSETPPARITSLRAPSRIGRRALLRTGVKVRVACDKACPVILTLRIGRLDRAIRGPVQTGPAGTTVVLKLKGSRSVRKALAGAKRVGVRAIPAAPPYTGLVTTGVRLAA